MSKLILAILTLGLGLKLFGNGLLSKLIITQNRKRVSPLGNQGIWCLVACDDSLQVYSRYIICYPLCKLHFHGIAQAFIIMLSHLELPEEVDIEEKFAPVLEYPLVGFHLTSYLVEGFCIFSATKASLGAFTTFLVFTKFYHLYAALGIGVD